MTVSSLVAELQAECGETIRLRNYIDSFDRVVLLVDPRYVDETGRIVEHVKTFAPELTVKVIAAGWPTTARFPRIVVSGFAGGVR